MNALVDVLKANGYSFIIFSLAAVPVEQGKSMECPQACSGGSGRGVRAPAQEVPTPLPKRRRCPEQGEMPAGVRQGSEPRWGVLSCCSALFWSGD